jgi:hypothetical protein
MGVTLDLRLIDHERIAVRGLEAVNEAIRKKDPEVLRGYLESLPIDVEPAEVDLRLRRIARLREFNAPPIIVENEERLLRFANGEAFQPAAYQHANFDELRRLLGMWCWASYCYSLDKSWNELHWFLEPAAGPDEYPLDPMRPRVGDPHQPVFAKALQGAEHYPLDNLGEPVIRTLGSREPDCSGYNPPAVAAAILAALQGVDTDSWNELVGFRTELYGRACTNLNAEDISDAVAEELDCAREFFPVLLGAYTNAVQKGFGVSCEFSL